MRVYKFYGRKQNPDDKNIVLLEEQVVLPYLKQTHPILIPHESTGFYDFEVLFDAETLEVREIRGIEIVSSSAFQTALMVTNQDNQKMLDEINPNYYEEMYIVVDDFSSCPDNSVLPGYSGLDELDKSDTEAA